ncbi:uncharacterized protein LOC110652188 isoform X2 [Hevea brasiliensis]|uniref:uncharacterized protein LOC110652188 isoform X2 n=1 Tax=Hevea brasiliensis TaxID=3981 RepID=UPI0025CF0C56|nr:uncharacterized protein LOC110652188 isoform X2 [Hevea brasiliensis]
MAMIRRRLPFSFPLLLLLFQFVQFHSLPFALAFHPNDTHILQGVLKEISQRQNWDFERITTSKLQVSKVRFGTAQRYEFQIRIGKNDLVLKFPDEVGSWNKFNKKRNDFGNFVREIGSSAVLDTFKVEGPFDLRVGDQDDLSLLLPLEIEKNVGRDETFDDVLEDWRTKPTVERVWFEVMARIEAEKLRVLMVKKVRPFVALDSVSWSNLMYNISFTKFPSILVPPESLTLDVKW